MELDCAGEDSGSGLALLPLKNELDRSDPLEACHSRIFDVHVSKLANAGKTLGLANALAMGVQDIMPILFRYSDDDFKEPSFLWRDTESTFRILDGDYAVERATPPFNRRQLINLWNDRYSAPDEIASSVVPPIHDLKAMRKKDYRLRPTTYIYDLHCDSCAFRFCMCPSGSDVDSNGSIDPNTKVLPMIFHLPGRMKCKEDIQKQKKGKTISSLSVEDLLCRSQYFDSMALCSISNSLAHVYFCMMKRPRYVCHLPMMEIGDDECIRSLITEVRSGRRDTYRPFDSLPDDFENRYSYVGYHELSVLRYGKKNFCQADDLFILRCDGSLHQFCLDQLFVLGL